MSSTELLPVAPVLIITPVLDDWESLGVVASGIIAVLPSHINLHFLIVDDGSQRKPDLDIRAVLSLAGRVSILRLARTVGHQRAIATGLRYAVRRFEFDQVVVMDSDGEDTPEGIVALLEAARLSPDSIIVARRGRRQENQSFRIGYRLYRAAFRVLTGLRLDFGNFCLLPQEAARRIVAEESVWSHFAATVVRSRFPKEEVVIDRGSRIIGSSHMNLYALVTHGLGAMAVFADRVFLRFAALSGLIALAATITLTAVAAIRFGTEAAIPGWATTAAGFALLVALQTLTMAVLMTFVMLQQRTGVLPLIAMAAGEDVAEVEEL